MSDINLKISYRLKEIIDYICIGDNLIDVGTDHAYIPIWLCKMGIIDYAIASDLRAGPLEFAKKFIDIHNLSDRICVRNGWGLEYLDSIDDIDIYRSIVIAGMGGRMILDILINSPIPLDNFNIVLQPMSQVEELRYGLLINGFTIYGEKIIKDGKIYNIFKVKKGAIISKIDPMSAFNPINLEDNRYLGEYISNIYSIHTNILDGMLRAKNADIITINRLKDIVGYLEILL